MMDDDMETESTTEVVHLDFREPISLFPLSDCVLLPQGLLPLHIFEPRYRRLVDDALDRTGVMAMGMLADEDAPAPEPVSAQPPLRPWIGIGLIRRYERMEDGRYLILLQGVCRARILGEIPHEPYRRVLAEPAGVQDADTPALLRARDRLRTQLHQPALDVVENIDRVREQFDVAHSVAAAVDGVLAELVEDIEQRYAMLVETQPGRRVAWLMRKLMAGSST